MTPVYLVILKRDCTDRRTMILPQQNHSIVFDGDGYVSCIERGRDVYRNVDRVFAFDRATTAAGVLQGYLKHLEGYADYLVGCGRPQEGGAT